MWAEKGWNQMTVWLQNLPRGLLILKVIMEGENKSMMSTPLFFCASKHAKVLGDPPVDSTDWFQLNLAEVDLHFAFSDEILPAAVTL